MSNDLNDNTSESITISSLDKKFLYSDKQLLIKRINDIKTKQCYIKIFKLIHNYNIQYTKNDNGVFINISNFDDNFLTKIDSILLHYEKKKNNTIKKELYFNN